MSNIGLLVLGLLGLICLTRAVSITKCKAEDSACIKLSAQAFVPTMAAGIPEFGSKSLDPLHIAKIENSSPHLKLVASDVVVTGMKGCTVDKISRTTKPSKIFTDIICTVDVQGEYDFKGKILLLPIDGNGHLSVQLSKILISTESTLGETEKNGQKYWTVSKWRFDWDLKDRAFIELKNLFGANEELTKAMRDMLGESANEVIKEVGPPIVKAITTEVVEAIKLFFGHVPINELELS